jgi:hypothetical protein
MNDTTPIEEAAQALGLSEEDSAAVLSLVGVRTLGDLRVVLERGEVEKALAATLKKALG